MIYRCDLVPQYLQYKDEINNAIAKVLNSGRYTLGQEVEFFEKEFAAYLKVYQAVGVASGTDALILALKTLGVGKGDEVITTAFTAIPTVSAIVAVGATPVFADIDPDTFLIDLDEVVKAITEKTKVVIPVHIFGNVVDIIKLKKILGRQIPIIEDACQAHGSSIHDKLTGSLGDLNAFSFYPTKNIGGYGDGGAITTQNSRLAKKVRLLRMYGMIDREHIIINGVNSRLDEIQSAILRIKLKYLDKMNKKRNKIASVYKKLLRKDLFDHQFIDKNIYCNYHVFVSQFKGNRKKIIKYLDQVGIQTNIYYPIPLHMQKANCFLGYKRGDLPRTEELCKNAIALPLYPEMSEEILNFIIEKINKFKN